MVQDQGVEEEDETIEATASVAVVRHNALLRGQVCNYLKSAFNAKDDIGARRFSVQPLVELFTKILTDEEKVHAFLDELTFRLDILVVTRGPERTRQRCLKAIAEFAISLAFHRQPEEPRVLNMLVQYCQKFSDAQGELVRHYVCLLVACIYEAASDRNTFNNSSENLDLSNHSANGNHSLLSSEHYRTLFNIVRERWEDPSIYVHRGAIRALAAIQDNPISANHEEAIKASPKELLMVTICGDPVLESRECQLLSLALLTVTSQKQIRLVLDIAVNNPDPEMRRVAMEKIIVANRDIRKLRIKDRIALLSNTLSNYACFKDVANRLLAHWLGNFLHNGEQQAQQPGTSVATAANTSNRESPFTVLDKEKPSALLNAAVLLICELDLVRNEQICGQTLSIVILNLVMERRNLSLVDFVSAICTANNEDDVAEEQLYVNRANFRQKLLSRRVLLPEKTALLFYWRALLQLCCSTYSANSEAAQLADCRFRLVPTLTEYARFVEDFLKKGEGNGKGDLLMTPMRGLNPPRRQVSPVFTRSARKQQKQQTQDAEAHEQLTHFCLRQIFRMFPLIDFGDDEKGKKHWRTLAFSVLANPNVTLREPFLQELVESIMHIHFPDETQSEVAVREFCDAINNIVQRDSNRGPILFAASPLPNPPKETSSSPSNCSTSSSQNASNNLSKLDDATRIRCLSICNSMLKSGRFQLVQSPELDGLYDALVTRESLASGSLEERAMAYECLGWRCLTDEREAEFNTAIMRRALELHMQSEGVPGPTKAVFLNLIGDLVAFYGLHRVANWYSKEPDMVEDSIVGQEVEDDVSAQRKLLDHFINYSKMSGKDFETVALCATENLCHWLLLDDCLREEEGDSHLAGLVLRHLLLRTFNTEILADEPESFFCLRRFLPAYAMVSRRNQRQLMHAFIDAFAELKELSAALREEARDIDELEMSRTVVQLTSYDVLSPEAIDREMGPVHTEFANKLLDIVNGHPHDFWAAIYLSMLPNLDPVEDLQRVEELIFLATDTMQKFEEDDEVNSTAKMTALRSYLRILNRRADYLRQNAGGGPQDRAVAGSRLNRTTAQQSIFTDEDSNQGPSCSSETPAKRVYSTRVQGSGRKKPHFTASSCAEQLIMPCSSGRKLSSSAKKKSPVFSRPVIQRAAKEKHRFLYRESLNFANISEEAIAVGEESEDEQPRENGMEDCGVVSSDEQMDAD